MPVQNGSLRLVSLKKFEEAIGVDFSDVSLLDTALTHRSCINEISNVKDRRVEHNERLEFLGDAVLGQAIAAFLYRALPFAQEGELSQIKSVVVSESILAEQGAKMGIPELLILGRGEELSGGRQKKALIADAFEAIVGAIYLDQGAEVAASFVYKQLDTALKSTIHGQSKDYKTILQEYAQKYLRTLPVYRCDRVEGPEHDRTFWISCILGPKTYGPFSGKTKKEAEQNAAMSVFESLSAEDPTIRENLVRIAGRTLS
ncbi:MAG TPA: ribonuclease III [Spirochaetales bacterium]|nr:ribonuclease III [Spirochaetales bacterium]